MPGPYPDTIPEGVSVYYGEYTCAQGLAGSVTVVFRSGGDITSIKLNGGPRSLGAIGSVGHHRAVGTYNERTNRFTEVPDERLVPKPGWVMAGRDGVYVAASGQLEGALVVNGVTAAPRGTFVHGRITQARQSGRMVGSSELAIEFTDLMVDDVLVPISTGELAAQTDGEAARTVGRTARAAAIGGLIGGSSGARTGAQVGVGASILTRGASINIPRGTIIETTLAAPLTVTP